MNYARGPSRAEPACRGRISDRVCVPPSSPSVHRPPNPQLNARNSTTREIRCFLKPPPNDANANAHGTLHAYHRSLAATRSQWPTGTRQHPQPPRRRKWTFEVGHSLEVCVQEAGTHAVSAAPVSIPAPIPCLILDEIKHLLCSTGKQASGDGASRFTIHAHPRAQNSKFQIPNSRARKCSRPARDARTRPASTRSVGARVHAPRNPRPRTRVQGRARNERSPRGVDTGLLNEVLPRTGTEMQASRESASAICACAYAGIGGWVGDDDDE